MALFFTQTGKLIMSSVLQCEMSDDQVVAMGLFTDWLKNSSHQEFRLGGLAGTGKTTLIKAMLAEMEGIEVEVITPTAKAAEVLGRKGVSAKTSHSLLCNFEFESKDADGRTIPVFSDKGIKRKVILCDEASMVTAEMRAKILECADRVVWIGDYGQLPPVEKGRPGTRGVLSEDNLDAKLTVQHRHGAALEIVNFAEYLREGRDPLKYRSGSGYCSGSSQVTINRNGVRGIAGVAKWCLAEQVWPVICYTNAFIDRFNLAIRKLQGEEWAATPGSIYPGLKLACVFNSYRYGVMNGELFEVEKLFGWRGNVAEILTTGGKAFPVTFAKENQGGAVRVMDGYAITCHKSQGSEWPKICVIEEREIMNSSRQWRYTAATRAQGQVDYFTKGAV